jgi:glycosyltransferase involved in cell wall biosynthesis
MYTLNDVTLVLISRSHALFVEECLESIKNEFQNDIKIVNIDVGSRDNTQEIIKENSQKKGLSLEYISLPYDTPTLLVLKTLSKTINSEFVILISADDTFGKDYRKALETNLESMEDPCVINFRLSITDSKLKQIKIRDPHWATSSRKNSFRLSTGNPGTAPGSLIPWNLLISDDSWKTPPPLLIEDYWIWWILVGKVNFINNTESTVNYRQHENNTSKLSGSPEYAFSLGYVSALPILLSKSFMGKFIGSFLIIRWLRHLNIMVWKYSVRGYLSALSKGKL